MHPTLLVRYAYRTDIKRSSSHLAKELAPSVAYLTACYTSRAVLAVDARDLLFQAEPHGALYEARLRLGLHACSLTFASDCLCAAATDSYFQRWAACVPKPSVDAIGLHPPVNGGIVQGFAVSMHALYFKAALTAMMAKKPKCITGGRDQHIITEVAFAFRRRWPAQVCMLPNDLARHSAFFNMGVSNSIEAVRLDESSGRVLGPDSRIIAILHQFDRRPTVQAFLRQSLGGKEVLS